MQPRLQTVALATLILLSGCIGSVASPTSPPSQTTHTASENSVQQLESASFWLSGTVARVEADTVYLEQGNDTVVPVTLTNHTDIQRCYQATVLNESTLACFDQFDVSDLQNPQGEEVCLSIDVEDRSIHAKQAFFNAVCGGPRLPSESSSFTREQ